MKPTIKIKQDYIDKILKTEVKPSVHPTISTTFSSQLILLEFSDFYVLDIDVALSEVFTGYFPSMKKYFEETGYSEDQFIEISSEEGSLVMKNYPEVRRIFYSEM